MMVWAISQSILIESVFPFYTLNFDTLFKVIEGDFYRIEIKNKNKTQLQHHRRQTFPISPLSLHQVAHHDMK